MLLQMCEAIREWGWSTALRESLLVFPIIEGLHLLGIALMLGPVLMLDLRLAGFAWTDQPVSKVAKTFVPYSVAGTVFMFITGILLFCATPVRAYESFWFRVKLVMLVIAGFNALYFHFKTQTTWGQWDDLKVPPTSARLAGITSMLFWAGVVFAGRWTAYNL